MYTYFQILYSLVPIKSPPRINFWNFLSRKCEDYDVNSVIKSRIMIINLDFVVEITSHVQTLLLDHVPPHNEVYF